MPDAITLGRMPSQDAQKFAYAIHERPHRHFQRTQKGSEREAVTSYVFIRCTKNSAWLSRSSTLAICNGRTSGRNKVIYLPFRISERQWRQTMADKEVIVERSSASGIGLILMAVAIIIAAAVAFAFLKNDNQKTDAVTGAAHSVSHAADEAGEAVNPNK
jgi:hypothetical protein